VIGSSAARLCEGTTTESFIARLPLVRNRYSSVVKMLWVHGSVSKPVRNLRLKQKPASWVSMCELVKARAFATNLSHSFLD
jgi:hypothetical protein